MSKPQHEQINPVRVLRQHAQRIATEHGLKLKYFAVVPGDPNEGEHDRAQIVMEYDPEAEKKPEFVLEEADATLTEAMLQAQREALEERAAEARKDLEDNLKKRLEGGGSFLDPQ